MYESLDDRCVYGKVYIFFRIELNHILLYYIQDGRDHVVSLRVQTSLTTL